MTPERLHLSDALCGDLETIQGRQVVFRFFDYSYDGAGIESRGVIPDGIALHAYTDSQGWNEVSFRDYQLKIANLPPSMRALPVYITEAGTGGPGNPTTNTGLIDAMFRHVHQWNASGGQQVRAVCFYRWAAGTDKWAIEDNPALRAHFVGSLSRDYQWFP